MKSLMKKLCIVIVLLNAGNYIYAQTAKNDVYVGIGFGFDYGGFGGKIEYLPAKNLGLFGGLGYNLSSLGWNLGATYKILPDKKISPNLMVFYGYNAVFIGDDRYAEKYDMTSYGFTFGLNLDIKSGNKGNKWSVGLFVPFRSSKFNDNYDAAKNDSNLEIDGELFPIGISFGYNFKL